MTERLLEGVASLILRRPVAVLLAVAALTVLLAANTRNLRLRTDISDLMGSSSPGGRAMREVIQEFGYGNRLFVVVEAGGAGEADAERMAAAADRLAGEMRESGLFVSGRCRVSDAEMLSLARFYLESFPSFADPLRCEGLAARLSPAGVRQQLDQATDRLLTSFSPIGPEYLVLDPLGLLDFLDASARDVGGFSGFDLEWGGGGYLFSRDHRALLILAEPVKPASDYEFAAGLMSWIRTRIAAVSAEGPPGDAPVRMTPVGAHAYADQNRALIERNIRVASMVSVGGNLMLVFLVYRWLPAIALTVLPTFLAILWTTGLVASWPGEVNLISLAFIAILAGLGDDQVTYFFTRIPQEIGAGRSLADAIRSTYVTTGKSVLFCILASRTGTLTLAMASFRGLAELGLVLTLGLLMLLVHTLFTIPALIRLFWPMFPVRAEGGPFRLLPAVAARVGAVVGRHPDRVLTAGVGALVAALATVPSLQTATKLETISRYDDPAFVGQRLLSSRFGLEGAPLVLLLEGTEQDVLTRTAALEGELEALRSGGQLRAVFVPTSLVPSPEQQSRRRQALRGLDLEAAAGSLEKAIGEKGLDPAAFRASVERLRGWAAGSLPTVTVESAGRALPPGLLDIGIRKLGPDRYIGAVTLYSGSPDATASLSSATVSRLHERAGPFAVFSYDHVATELNDQIVRDSRKASLLATAAVVLIVAALFRSIRVALLVLLPIASGIVLTMGVLAAAGHRVGGMGFAAYPLILGLGIDNSIHLVRRHLERPGRDVRQLLGASGAALIQTNLSTIVGFGALLSATIPPLAELGLITALGIGFTLLASLFLIPAILALAGRRGSLPAAGPG